MWDGKAQKRILAGIRKGKDLYKFLEFLSLIHTEVAEDFKKQKTLNLREDSEFIGKLMKIITPEAASENKIGDKQSFDLNIYYALEGLSLGLKEYLDNRPKEDAIETAKEEDIKGLLDEAYRNLVKSKKEADLAYEAILTDMNLKMDAKNEMENLERLALSISKA